jgi:hypothetical protein
MFDVHLSKKLSAYGVKGIMMEPTEIARIKALDEQIQIIKAAALELKNLSGGVQAADCNANRILASAKMLEINFSNLLTIL